MQDDSKYTDDQQDVISSHFISAAHKDQMKALIRVFSRNCGYWLMSVISPHPTLEKNSKKRNIKSFYLPFSMEAGIFTNQAIKSYLSHQTFTGSASNSQWDLSHVYHK